MKTKVYTIHPVFPEIDKISECARVIRNGGLVVFPTETVYGLAANLNHKKAMERLRQVKRRSEDKPFSILVSRKEEIDQLANIGDYHVYKLVDEFWPGPVTLVVPSKKENKTIGLRMPQNTIALYLTREAQCPIAAPSANPEGATPPINCKETLEYLEGQAEIAIDGGVSSVGQASTVVDATGNMLKILREGPVKQESLEHIFKRKNILFVCTGNSCRSVMAEYLLKEVLKDRRDVKVASAGTSVFVNMGASEDTITILKKKGIDAREHYSQPINTVMLKKSDLIIVMTRSHRRMIIEKVPAVKNRVYLLKEFAKLSVESEEDLDVVDPIGKSLAVYEECLTVIQEAIQRIVKLI